MKKIYSYITLALLTSATLSSCSRTDYAFKPNTSPYHGVQQSVRVATAAPVEQADESVVASEVPQSAAAAISVATSVAPARPAKLNAKLKAVTPAKLAVTTVPKKVVEKLAHAVEKQLDKHQDAAAINQPAASKAGRAAIVGGIGLLLLILGGAAGIGILALLGLIAFLVGAVMLIIALINGD